MTEQQGYYVVGVHGPPTAETAPHGLMFRVSGHGAWIPLNPLELGYTAWQARMEWYPLPAPPTAPASAPEPVARWLLHGLADGGDLDIDWRTGTVSNDDIRAAVAALNALDRDGVAWGEMRPPETLPETGRVLVAFTNGHVGIRSTWDLGDRRLNVTGWWPLAEAHR